MHQHSFLSKEKRYLKTRKLYLNKFSEIDKNRNNLILQTVQTSLAL